MYLSVKPPRCVCVCMSTFCVSLCVSVYDEALLPFLQGGELVEERQS